MPHTKFEGRRPRTSGYRKNDRESGRPDWRGAGRPGFQDDRAPDRVKAMPEHPNYMDDRLPYPGAKPLFPPLTHRISATLDQGFLRALRGVWPLNRAHRASLAADTAALSELLTVNRTEMRSPYWSSPAATSAYLYYFLPWNLIRLCRLFFGLELPAPRTDAPSLLLDLGSGPLTVPLALWLSHPEWRTRPIEVVAVDAAGRPPKLGRDILSSLRGCGRRTLDRTCGSGSHRPGWAQGHGIRAQGRQPLASDCGQCAQRAPFIQKEPFQ